MTAGLLPALRLRLATGLLQLPASGDPRPKAKGLQAATGAGRFILTDIGDRLCSARVVFDLVAQGELGAGVAGGGGVELVAQGGEGAGSARGGQRVEPDGQGAAAGDD